MRARLTVGEITFKLLPVTITNTAITFSHVYYGVPELDKTVRVGLELGSGSVLRFVMCTRCNVCAVDSTMLVLHQVESGHWKVYKK